MKPTGIAVSTAVSIGRSAASRANCSNADSIPNQSGKARRMLSQIRDLSRGRAFSIAITASAVPASVKPERPLLRSHQLGHTPLGQRHHGVERLGAEGFALG